jgi:hypothetical protein
MLKIVIKALYVRFKITQFDAHILKTKMPKETALDSACGNLYGGVAGYGFQRPAGSPGCPEKPRASLPGCHGKGSDQHNYCSVKYQSFQNPIPTVK